MRRLLLSLGAITATAIATGRSAQCQAPLVVHEWGTLTTRHAPNGTPQGRLNRIEPSEALPPFVHRYEPPAVADNPEKSLIKAPQIPGRPDVTMRLETPVIYFYRPAGASAHSPFQVTVQFRGGVINEFYPNAEASVVVDAERIQAKIANGSFPGAWTGDVLDSYVVGRLLWRDVALSDSAALPATSRHVWLAPRRVPATNVVTGMESERYLFYRGVAHLDALLQTELLPKEVILRAPRALAWMHQPVMTITKAWLVDSRADGSVAFKEHSPIIIDKSGPGRELARVPRFADRDYTASNLARLLAAMKQSLVGAGLFDCEAEAMLETWRSSYFGAPGLRLFYLVPNEWTGYFLPLRISAPNELTRVLVGRIDLLLPDSERGPSAR